MRVVLDLRAAEGAGRPPAGAPAFAEVRDTSLQDVSSVTLGRARAAVTSREGAELAAIEIDYEPTPGSLTAWAHVDVDGDGRVTAGDWITMESFPIGPGQERISITLRPVTPASRRSPG